MGPAAPSDPSQRRPLAPRALDPRTVPRRALLEKAGFPIPAVTLIVLSPPTNVALAETLARLLIADMPPCQIVASFGPADGWAQTIGGNPPRHRPGNLPLTLRVATADETLPGFLNRAASVAVGETIVFAFDAAGFPAACLAPLVDRFREDAHLGILDRVAMDCAPPLLAVRSDLWTALDGFAENFRSLDWAIRDLCLRARAIGYRAPPRPRTPGPAVLGGPGLSPGVEAVDEQAFDIRAATAPDRSEMPAQRGFAAGTTPRCAVYTTLTDRYDSLKPQLSTARTEFVAFLDAATAEANAGRSRGWTVRPFVPSIAEPQRASRFYKINAHLALPEVEYSLWIDASISIAFPFPLARLAELFLVDADICAFRHHTRTSIYDEAEACKALERDAAEIIDAQIARYRADGLPANVGLAELPVILRRHTAAVRAFNEAWWAEIMAGSRRDQLSFDYVGWKLRVPYANFPLILNDCNGLFRKFRRVAGS